MALAAKLATYPEEAEERRERRSRLWLNLPSEAAGAAVTNVTIHDLSTGGLLVQADADLPIGAEIAVELPEAGTATASVVWSSGHYFGCAFAAPVSPAAVDAALSQSRVVYPDFPLPTEPPPLRPPPRAAEPAAEDAHAEGGDEAERGDLSVSARILSIVAISLLLWTAIIWGALSLL